MKRIAYYLVVALSTLSLVAGCSFLDVKEEAPTTPTEREDVLKMAEMAEAPAKITSLTQLDEAPAKDDVLPIVDISDPTMAATGTTKKIEVTDLMGYPSHKLQDSASTYRSFYYRSAISGVTAAMDDIPVASLSDGDACLVVNGDVVYIYQFHASSTEAELSPTYIRPDDYATQGVWFLVGLYASSINVVPGADPNILFRDTTAPGDDKDMGRFKIVYASGGDGAENADVLIYVTKAGVEDTLVMQYDNSDDRWEIPTGTKFSTGAVQWTASGTDYISGSALGDHGKEVIGILVYNDGTNTTVEDGAGDVFFRIPSKINGWNLIEVAAQVQTAGVTGNLDVMVYNVTQTADMLSTAMRVETGETDTSTSAQPGTIDTNNDDVATGDSIRIDVDAVQTGTAAKGLWVELTFQAP